MPPLREHSLLNESGEPRWWNRLPGLQVGLVFCVAGLYLASIAVPLYHAGNLFWDAQVYSRGIHTYLAGGDPYQHFSKLNFVYPPSFLHVAALLCRGIPFRVIAGVYLMLSCVAVFLLPLVLVFGYLKRSWLTPGAGAALFFFHPRMTAQDAFLSANMSSLLYCAVLAAGVPGVRRGRWLLFYFAVACASIVKPPLLSLLLIPLFLGSGQLAGVAITMLVSLGEKLVERIVWPLQYKAFVDSVQFQLVTLKDNGIGLTRYFVHFNLGSRVPVLHESFSYVLHGCVIGVLVASLWFRRKERSVNIPDVLWSSMVLVTAILMSPRVLTYDIDVAILPATLLLVEAVMTALQRKVKVVLIAAPILAFAVLVVRSSTAAIYFYVLAAAVAFLVGLYRKHVLSPKPAGAIN